MQRVSMAAAVTAAAALTVILLPSPAPVSAAGPRDEHTVVVSEAVATYLADGCGAISVFDDRDNGDAAFRGPHLPALGWLTADWSHGLFIASPGPGLGMYRLQRLSGELEWRAGRLHTVVYSPAAALSVSYGGLALVDDGAALISAAWRGPSVWPAVGRFANPGSVITGFLQVENVAPTGPSLSNVIIASPEGEEVVVLTGNSELYTHRVSDLSYSAPTIALPPIVLDTIYAAPFFHAALSPGGRYFITGRADLPEFTIVDRRTMAVTAVDASRWITMTGDFAFSAGWHNDGLLAVHGGGRIGVFRFDPAGAFEPLAIATVAAPRWGRDQRRAVGGPIAWSGDGSRIIAGISNGASDFGVYAVRDCGRRIELEHEWAVCPSKINLPQDIVTANGQLPTPMGYTPSCPTPSWNDDYTPGPHTTSTITPTPFEESITEVYLPAALRMRAEAPMVQR